MKKKLVIVSYFFPPFNNVASRRWAEMIPELSNHYEMYVFTTLSKGNLEIPKEVKEIHRFKNILLTSPSTVSSKKKGFVGSIITKARRGLRTIDSTYVKFYLKNREEFIEKMNEIDPAYILTTLGPFSSGFFGQLAKKKIPDLRWIVDIRDSISLYPHVKKNFLKRKLDSYLDYSLIKRSDHIVTVSSTLADLFSKFYKKEVSVVYNGYYSNEFTKNEDSLVRNTIFYGGKIYPHQLDSLKIVSNALAKSSKKFELVVRLVNSEMKGAVREILERDELKFKLLPPTDNHTFLEESSKSDLLLILESLKKNNEIGRGTLTGKLFNYLPQSAPILAVCRTDSEIVEILSRTKRGIVLEEESAIVAFLENLHTANLQRDAKEVALFSRTAQANRFSEKLNELK